MITVGWSLFYMVFFVILSVGRLFDFIGVFDFIGGVLTLIFFVLYDMGVNERKARALRGERVDL